MVAYPSRTSPLLSALHRHYAQVIQTISRSPALHAGQAAEVFQDITSACSRALGTNRVGLWLMRPDGNTLHCVALHGGQARTDGPVRENKTGDELHRHNYPAYFAALESSRSIVAVDAATNPATSEFSGGYLEGFDIRSMLDVPILVDGKLAGVLCAEHVGATRAWTPEDAAFVASMGDLASLALSTQQLRRTEQALRRREEELNIALDAANMGTWRWDATSQTVHWTPQLSQIYHQPRGWAPQRLSEYYDLVHADDQQRVRDEINAMVQGESEFFSRHRIIRGDGRLAWVEAHATTVRNELGHVLGVSGTSMDITRAQELAEQLERAKRLEALGRLAGGIAHDFNNLLSSTLTSVDLLLMKSPDLESRTLLNTVVSSIERASRLTGQLLQFARRQPGQPRVLDLGAATADLQELLTRLLPDSVSLAVHHPSAPAWVLLDPGHVEQIVINLVVNARDAMEGTGEIVINVSELEDTVMMCIVDDGPGIPPHVLPRVFDPFFTTRSDGTGLGLATCYGIVEQAGGTITAGGTHGKGAVFTITLPRAEPPAPVAPAPLPEAAVPTGRVGTVLLVEDEAPLRELLDIVLTRRGYKVLVARSGDEALGIATRTPDLRLLVTDVSLPGMSGPKLVEVLDRPTMPVLFISGFTQDPLDLRDGQAFLHKPFRINDLYRAIDELLSTSA